MKCIADAVGILLFSKPEFSMGPAKPRCLGRFYPRIFFFFFKRLHGPQEWFRVVTEILTFRRKRKAEGHPERPRARILRAELAGVSEGVSCRLSERKSFKKVVEKSSTTSFTKTLSKDLTRNEIIFLFRENACSGKRIRDYCTTTRVPTHTFCVL